MAANGNPKRQPGPSSQAANTTGSEATFTCFTTMRASSTAHTDVCFSETSSPA